MAGGGPVVAADGLLLHGEGTRFGDRVLRLRGEVSRSPVLQVDDGGSGGSNQRCRADYRLEPLSVRASQPGPVLRSEWDGRPRPDDPLGPGGFIRSWSC